LSCTPGCPSHSSVNSAKASSGVMAISQPAA
jgi:hypothetical protein